MVPRETVEDGAVILYDAQRLEHAQAKLFDPGWWRTQGEVTEPAGGRGAAWLLDSAMGSWVLRHYRRGGWVARFIEDRYLWLGLRRSRPWREWRITAELYRRGLPVPRPVAAACWREGLLYRADLITERVSGVSVGVLLEQGGWNEEIARQVGEVVAQLHAGGARHADLNVHNILVHESGVHIIDFDKARLYPAAGNASGDWQRGNLARLRRSFNKVLQRDADRDPPGWRSLMDGYTTA